MSGTKDKVNELYRTLEKNQFCICFTPCNGNILPDEVSAPAIAYKYAHNDKVSYHVTSKNKIVKSKFTFVSVPDQLWIEYNSEKTIFIGM